MASGDLNSAFGVPLIALAVGLDKNSRICEIYHGIVKFRLSARVLLVNIMINKSTFCLFLSGLPFLLDCRGGYRTCREKSLYGPVRTTPTGRAEHDDEGEGGMARILFCGLVLIGLAVVGSGIGVRSGDQGAAAHSHANAGPIFGGTSPKIFASLHVARERGVAEPRALPRAPVSTCRGTANRSCRSVG